MKTETVYKVKNDLLGSIAALTCAIHCLVLPVFFTTLPLLGIELIENGWLELLTIGISLLAGGFAIYRGYRYYHRSRVIIALFTAGMLSMIAGNLFHMNWPEKLLKSGGAILLIASQFANWKKSHAASCSMQAKP